MTTRIGVIFGGRSGEHEISVRSAKTVIEQIDKERYEVIPIAIAKDGGWLNPSESLKLLPADTGSDLRSLFVDSDEQSVALVGDTRYKGLTTLDASGRFTKLDVIFPVLHGTYGEGTWTFLGGHDPEDPQHQIGDAHTDLSMHPHSPGYRLILNNVLFPAAKKKTLKT